LPQWWKESIIVPIYEKDDKTDCNNYRGISLSLTAYKILSNILLTRSTPYVSEVLLEFGIPKKLVRLIKMCLNEAYSKVRRSKLLSHKFLIQNGLK
jgi:hypothetical protein